MRKQIDLTTLPGWANLSDGNHTIKIKAKGTGYKESELSAGVTVSKAPSTVTLEKGTYKWVDNPDLIEFSYVRFSYTTVGVTYMGISIAEDCILYSTHVFGTYGYFKVYESVSGKKPYWGYYDDDHKELNVENTACQTITLATDQTVSAEFYKWAITDGNLVKQNE